MSGSHAHDRPKETVENVTASDDALDVAAMTIEERNRLKREILCSAVGLRADLRQAPA
jgi:hypothetical protein